MNLSERHRRGLSCMVNFAANNLQDCCEAIFNSASSPNRASTFCTQRSALLFCSSWLDETPCRSSLVILAEKWTSSGAKPQDGVWGTGEDEDQAGQLCNLGDISGEACGETNEKTLAHFSADSRDVAGNPCRFTMLRTSSSNVFCRRKTSRACAVPSISFSPSKNSSRESSPSPESRRLKSSWQSVGPISMSFS